MQQNLPNPELRLAADFVEQTQRNLFLTGKAGTGKTTFLRKLRERSPKRMIVVAPTGVAAINAGGVTIHSFFQMPFGPYLPGQAIPEESTAYSTRPGADDRQQRFSREKIRIMRSLDLLVIDEISMVRADLLDAIDAVLRRFRDRSLPFGGVQLLMIGDLQQLAPVAKEEEWAILRPYYDTIFFFSSHALRLTRFSTIELKHIYRQSDDTFIGLLNRVRDNQIDQATLDALNSRYIAGFDPDQKEGYITLTTHNHQALTINEARLEKLKGREFRFTARIEGDFPEYSYPTGRELLLKKGAQVMFVRNDSSPMKLFFNGKIGTITDISKEHIRVECDGDADPIEVGISEWENNKYTIDEETKEIRETPVGKFIQYPLKLAWAITIHKSQGLTFEKAVIDANAAFAHGQVYVALSRCRTFDGLVLSSPITQSGIRSDNSINGFSEDARKNQPGEEELQASRIAYQQALLAELLDFGPMQRRLNHFRRLLTEYANALAPGTAETVEKIHLALRTDLEDVAARFRSQVAQLLADDPMVEGNEPLQERIRKACTYFFEKTDTLICSPLREIDIETDNKATRKLLNDSRENLMREAQISRAGFATCKEGFTVKTFLDARAKASIETLPAKKERKTAFEAVSGADPDEALIRRIKDWRYSKAAEEKVPVYMVLPQKTLYELTVNRPDSIRELGRIKGLGKKKLEKYGAELLSLLRESSGNPERETGPDEESFIESPPKAAKVKTQEISLQMFKEGKSPEEIAAERGYTVGTIHGHLAKYVASGEVDIHRLISDEKLEKISQFFREIGSRSLSEAREILGEEYGYDELRLVRAWLEASASESGE
jgi:hypothetical protein